VFRGQPLVVVLEGVQDPGNAGAIIRAAEAFGATGLLFLKGTVSPYGPKAVRASAGSVFRMPLVAGLDVAGRARPWNNTGWMSTPPSPRASATSPAWI